MSVFAPVLLTIALICVHSQRMAFQALKTKSDVSLRAINSLPEKLPVIDWAAYQSVNSGRYFSTLKKKVSCKLCGSLNLRYVVPGRTYFFALSKNIQG